MKARVPQHVQCGHIMHKDERILSGIDTVGLWLVLTESSGTCHNGV